MSAYGTNWFLSRTITRLIISYAVIAITLTVFGMVNVSKDAFGSHANFGSMKASDFREGDIVHGTITETLGYAATMEHTYSDDSSSPSRTDYYFIVPYYDSAESNVPDRIIVYKTGNTEQFNMLEKLKYETVYWYVGDYSSTMTHLSVDRAEVVSMSSQEYNACTDYIDDFLDAYYQNVSAEKRNSVKNSYRNALIPFVVQYKADFGAGFLTVGLVMIGIFIIGTIVFIAVSRGKNSSEPTYTYIGKAPGSDPNLNSPTGLKNAGSNPYFNNNSGGYIPKQTNSFTSSGSSVPGLRKDYSNSERPLPPAGTGTDRKQADMKREMNFDPYTGKPINKPSASPFGDSRKTTLVDTVFGGQPNRQIPPHMQQMQRNRNVIKADEGMPSVDPNNLEQVDLSNGGVEPDAWENRGNNAQMPMNGSIPVINPESHNAAAMFGSIIPTEPEEKPAEAPHETVDPIHPATSAENIDLDIQVEQTDPETRNVYEHMAGGEMNAVDPYTEKNVDTSNGGIELPESESPLDSRRSFPETAPTPSSAQATSFPQAQAFPDPTPAPEPLKPAPEPIKAPEPEKNDSYNIFKTDSSPYIREYTGGSSYNIFKSDDKKDDVKPDSGDNASGMGFPTENKEFPKLDTSFPTAGESDVGGKDDFIF